MAFARSYRHSGRWTVVALMTAAAAFGSAQTDAFLSHPDIHGDRIVFTAEGDLWLADAGTGEAWRITSDPGMETAARFSPDGSMIAFTAGYDGGSDVYVMPAAGGVPKRLTFDAAPEELSGSVVTGWTPDGKNVLFTSGSSLYAPKFEQQTTQELFSVPVSGGLPKRLPVPRATYATLSADGRILAYVPSSNAWMNWFRYQGGEADQIWTTDLTTHRFTRLTDSGHVDTQPAWLNGNLYFVSERGGVRNLWRLDPATKRTVQATFSTDLPVRDPASDGKRIIYQLGPRLAIYDPKTNTSKTVPIRLHSDRVHARPYEIPIAGPVADRSRMGDAIDPKGTRVARAVRGHLVTVAVGEGPMHTLVGDSSQRAQNPAWSPDGKTIAYVSDASGEEEVYLIADEDRAVPRRLTHGLEGQHGTPSWSPDGKWLLLGNRTGGIQLIDAATGTVKTIAQNQGENAGYGLAQDFTFSPDGRWVAYALSAGWRFGTVYLYEIATGRTIRVSHPDIDSGGPAFSPDGKYLFVLQGRNITQEWTGISGRMSQIYKAQVTGYCLNPDVRPPSETSAAKGGIVPEGLSERVFDLGVAPGRYTGLLPLAGSLLVQTESGLLTYDYASGKTKTWAEGVHLIEPSRDGKKLLVEGPSGLQAIDAEGGPIAVGAGAIKMDGLTISIDPQAEWRQIFEESWRIARDFFYAPNMHGVDWAAVRKKYEAQLPLVACRVDLLFLLRSMISELNTGHCFTGAWPEFVGRTARPAVLGADLEWDTAAGAYRIARILKGNAWNPNRRSPFAEPGLKVREGDYLFKIGGQTLRGDENPASLLLGTAGRPTEVTVGASPSTARVLTIKPLASDLDLRTSAWVEERRAYVEKASGGQIAYVNLGDMGGTGATQYAQQYYPNVEKPGILFDIRGNDGGNISGNVLSDLTSRSTGYFAYRAGGNYRRENWAPRGQLALLANEWSFSDADFFSEWFKRLQVGPLIGHRTAGGTVGPAGYRLVDGSGIGIPNYGAWTGNEWIVEGRGAVPDVEIDQDPTALLAGRDPQLEKAVEILLARIKAHPLPKLVPPAYPVKTGGSRG